MNNDENIMYALRNVQAALEQTGREINVLVEQIGTHTVVSTEFALPEHWYVPNCPEATEWAKAVCSDKGSWDTWHKYLYIMNSKEFASSAINTPLRSYTHITHDQFITHVYLPWKAEKEKPKYWKRIADPNQMFKIDSIHEGELDGDNHIIVIDIRSKKNLWQPATESEYLAQEAAKQSDVSNVEKPKFKVGDRVESLHEFPLCGVKKGEVGTVVNVGLHGLKVEFLAQPMDLANNLVKPYTPPKFDPTTADKTKMYFAVHKEYGNGIVSFQSGDWWFSNALAQDKEISHCTHIDHEPIQRRN